MINFIELYVGIVILWLYVYYTGNILLEPKVCKVNIVIKIMIFAFLTTLLNMFDSEVLRGFFKVICIYSLFCAFYKIVFNVNYSKTLLTSLIAYIFVFVSEILLAILLSFIFANTSNPVGLLKNTIFVNITVAIFAYIFVIISKGISIPLIRESNDNKISVILLAIIILCTISMLLFRIPVNKWVLNFDFLATMIILLGFCIIGLYLLKQRSEINQTQFKYQQEIKYARVTSKVLEDYRMINHEHKNQLSIIRGMANKDNQELIKYIDSLINTRDKIKYKWVGELNYIPLNELISLINYKLIEAEEFKIKTIVTISKNISKIKLEKMSMKEKNHLYSMCGIYLDNAIQAACKSKNKQLNIDIYKEEKDFVIIIANTFKGKIELEKIDEYGYSTKGKNHGVGLHIAKTIMDEDKLFSQSRKILDHYYIQELRINIGELGKNKK